MAKSSLDMVKQEEAVEISWRAFELRPGGSAPEPDYQRTIEARWPQTIEMGRQFGVEMKTHRFGVDTRPAHRALKIVEKMEPDRAEDYGMALFRAYFEEDKDLGDPTVLQGIADALGLDGGELAERLAGGEARTAVLMEERQALESGIHGVPAFVIEGKYLVSGVQPPEQLRAILDEVRRREGL